MSLALSGSTPIRPRTASAHQLVHQFQELPLHWQYADKIAWRGALIDGQFEISYDSPTDWWVSDIWLSLDNGRCGAEALGRLVNIKADDDERFYLLVLDAIDHKYASWIEEWIADEMAASGLSIAA